MCRSLPGLASLKGLNPGAVRCEGGPYYRVCLPRLRSGGAMFMCVISMHGPHVPRRGVA